MAFTGALYFVTVTYSQGSIYVRGLLLFEGCGIEAVMGGVCIRCPLNV